VPERKDIAVKVHSLFPKQWTFTAIYFPSCNFTNDHQSKKHSPNLMIKHAFVTWFLMSSNHSFYCDQWWHCYIALSTAQVEMQNLHNRAWQIVKQISSVSFQCDWSGAGWSCCHPTPCLPRSNLFTGHLSWPKDMEWGDISPTSPCKNSTGQAVWVV